MPKNNFAPRLDAAYQIDDKRWCCARLRSVLRRVRESRRQPEPRLQLSVPVHADLPGAERHHGRTGCRTDRSSASTRASGSSLDPLNVNANGLTMRGVEFDYKTPRYHNIQRDVSDSSCPAESLDRDRLRRDARPQPRDVHRDEQRHAAAAAGHQPDSRTWPGPTSRAARFSCAPSASARTTRCSSSSSGAITTACSSWSATRWATRRPMPATRCRAAASAACARRTWSAWIWRTTSACPASTPGTRSSFSGNYDLPVQGRDLRRLAR